MNETVLIIDDEEDLLQFLSEVLSESYTVYTASSAAHALSVLNERRVHLIVSDVMMPGMDGFELCAKLKSEVEHCHIPIILLTAKNTITAKIEGLKNGADAYIEKPFSHELLLVQVSNLLNNRSKIQDHAAYAPFDHVRLSTQSKSENQFLKKLNEFINRNLSNSNFDIDQLAEYMNMSRPTFYRKIKSLTNIPIKDIIKQAKLKRAVELMAENDHRIFEIAKMVGYRSQTVFGKNFQKYFGQSPKEYVAGLRNRAKSIEND
jgi:DNA-binding NtrC family response regulator